MITVTLTNKQTKVLVDALDAYTRAKVGQFSYSLDHMVKTPKGASISIKTLLEIEKQLIKLFFPELKQNQCYGITNEEVPDEARIAYDIYQVLCEKLPTENISHMLKTSKTQEPPTVEGDFDE